MNKKKLFKYITSHTYTIIIDEGFVNIIMFVYIVKPLRKAIAIV